MIESVLAFVRESNLIEGIDRDPTDDEVAATIMFLHGPLDLLAVTLVQSVYAPGKFLRAQRGMNVQVGRYVAPLGGPEIPQALDELCRRISDADISPWHGHVEFEKLHPFMDGNGRTGRAVWAWHMRKAGHDPFALPFLHRFYYQTLAAS